MIDPTAQTFIFTARRFFMQYNFSLLPDVYERVEQTLSRQRLRRYLPAAGGDWNKALRLYLWNARLCAAFYLPTQLCEVACRNALHRALSARFGAEWHVGRAFRAGLPTRLLKELDRAADAAQAEGPPVAADHVVARMSLGFWLHLVSKRPARLLWKDDLGVVFPGLPAHARQDEVYARFDRFRTWRNRIAHHNAIFDRGPVAELQNMGILLGWTCPETRRLMLDLSGVSRAVNERRWA